MASLRKHNKGWRAEVFRHGIRKSKIFPSKREAQDWAARTEYEIEHADKVADKTPLGDVFDRYAREVSPRKKGGHWEIIRLEKLQRDQIAKIQMVKLAPADFADWRDQRLKEVQPASVIREMQLMSSVLSTARREWGMISQNPMSDVSKPRKPQPRDRLPNQSEIDAMLHCAGAGLGKATARAFHAFQFALETGSVTMWWCGSRTLLARNDQASLYALIPKVSVR